MSFATISFFQLPQEINSTFKWVQTNLSDPSFSGSMGSMRGFISGYLVVWNGESALHLFLLLGFEINNHHPFSIFFLLYLKPSFTYLDTLKERNKTKQKKLMEWFVPWSSNLKKKIKNGGDTVT